MNDLAIIALVNAGVKIFQTVHQMRQLQGKNVEETQKILDQLIAYRQALQTDIKTLEDRIKEARESGL